MNRIHVRRDTIAKDTKQGTWGKAVGIETTGRKKRYAYSVTLTGPAKLIYNPLKPLSCGARAWIETDAKVILHGQSWDGRK